MKDKFNGDESCRMGGTNMANRFKYLSMYAQLITNLVDTVPRSIASDPISGMVFESVRSIRQRIMLLYYGLSKDVRSSSVLYIHTYILLFCTSV